MINKKKLLTKYTLNCIFLIVGTVDKNIREKMEETEIFNKTGIKNLCVAIIKSAIKAEDIMFFRNGTFDFYLCALPSLNIDKETCIKLIKERKEKRRKRRCYYE